MFCSSVFISTTRSSNLSLYSSTSLGLKSSWIANNVPPPFLFFDGFKDHKLPAHFDLAFLATVSFLNCDDISLDTFYLSIETINFSIFHTCTVCGKYFYITGMFRDHISNFLTVTSSSSPFNMVFIFVFDISL